jgi:hypothetical protein
MNKKIKKLAKKAGFVIWGDESWGPGKGNVDWSSNYDRELKKFAKLIRKEYAKKDPPNYDNELKKFAELVKTEYAKKDR